MVFRSRAVALLVPVAALCAPVAAAPQFWVADLGRAENVTIRDLNDLGDYVGSIEKPDGSSIAFACIAGTLTELGTLGGQNSHAWAINNALQIVGCAEVTGTTSEHAFLYEGGLMTDLGTLGGAESRAYDINAGGVVVGSSELPNGNLHAFRYSQRAMQDLGTLGGDHSWARAVNDSGLVAGSSETGDTPPMSTQPSVHAFLFSGGAMTDMGTAMGWCYVTGLNNSGHFCGTSMNIGGRLAFVHDGGFREVQGGCTAGQINDAGWVTASEYVPHPPFGYSGAFLYVEHTTYDLNALLEDAAPPDVTFAGPLNNFGQIIAKGTRPGETEAHYYLLTLVPEPALAAMLIVGCAPLLRRRGR